MLLLAVFDQASTTGLRLGHDENARQFDVDRAFVTRLESHLQKGAMVFQLPHTGVPVERTFSRMLTYDHGRAYLHSRSLRWSWGAIVGRNGNWPAEIQNLSPRALVRTLALAGFSGVWIDRFGYEPPPVGRLGPATVHPSPEAAVVRFAGEPPETSSDGRYVFVGLETVRRRLVAELGTEGFAREAEKALRAPLVPRYREGFGEEDGDGARVWRAGGPRGRIVIMNPVNREREVLLTAQLLPLGAGKEAIEVSSPQFTDAVTAVPGGTAYRRTAFLPARRRLQIHFSCPERPSSGAEPCFRLVDFQVTDAGPTPEIETPARRRRTRENEGRHAHADRRLPGLQRGGGDRRLPRGAAPGARLARRLERRRSSSWWTAAPTARSRCSKGIAAADPSVRVLALSARFGHQMSLLAGLDHCDSDAVVMMDSDLQHPPSLIPELLAGFEQRPRRRLHGARGQPGGPRPQAADLALVLPPHQLDLGHARSTRARPTSGSSPAAWSRSSRSRSASGTSSCGGSSAGSASRACAVRFKVGRRPAGRTKYSVRRMVRFGVDGVVSFSKTPLQAAVYFGFAFGALGFLYALVTLAQFLLYRSFPSGWTTIIILISIFSGTQLVFLGILGEYLGAIFDEVKARPHYIVEERVNFPPRPGAPA